MLWIKNINNARSFFIKNLSIKILYYHIIQFIRITKCIQHTGQDGQAIFLEVSINKNFISIIRPERQKAQWGEEPPFLLL